MEKTNKYTDDGELVSRFWTKIGLMAEITAIFRETPPGKTTYRNVLEMIRNVIPYSAASLYLNNNKCGDLTEVIKIDSGFEISDYPEIGPDFKEWAKNLRAPVKVLRSTDNGNSRMAYIVPLIVEKSMIGIAIYVVDGDKDLRDQDCKLLSITSDQMAMSIERLVYQKRLEERNASLAKAHEQLRAMQSELIKDEKLLAVRELAVSINHEINNPLSVITGNVEYLLYLNKNLDEMIKGRLQIIASEAVKIADINRRLLDIQTLVSEDYLNESNRIKMLNLEKSASGDKNDGIACTR